MNRGGKRPGAGRPKGGVSQKTKLKRLTIEQAGGHAERALALMVEVMDKPLAPLKLRMEAAREVMDRVWGKPKQAINHEGAVGITIADARTKLADILARKIAEPVPLPTASNPPGDEPGGA
jgi:hypothetical protein